MLPCIDDNIPVYVRNIFNPSFAGTVIQGRSPTLEDRDSGKAAADLAASQDGTVPIKGITSIDKVSGCSPLEPYPSVSEAFAYARWRS